MVLLTNEGARLKLEVTPKSTCFLPLGWAFRRVSAVTGSSSLLKNFPFAVKFHQEEQSSTT